MLTPRRHSEVLLKGMTFYFINLLGQEKAKLKSNDICTFIEKNYIFKNIYFCSDKYAKFMFLCELFVHIFKTHGKCVSFFYLACLN